MMPKNHLKKNRMRGLASLEFTLIFTALYAPLLLGVIDIGRVLYQYNIVVKNVRSAARYMSVTYPADPNYASRITEAKNLVVYGALTSAVSPMVSGMTASNVSIVGPVDASAGGVKINLITVRVSDFNLGYVTKFFGANATKSFGTIEATMRQTTP